MVSCSKKFHLGSQNGFRSSRLEKQPKIVNYATIKETERNNGGGLSGISRWPPISTWINTPPSGSNGPHCIECFHEMGELLVNLVLGEPLTLV